MAEAGKHTYLKGHRISGATMSLALSEEGAALLERAKESRAGRAAKTLAKEGAMRVTLVALARGAALQQHAVEAPVSIQVLRGRLDVHAAGRTMRLTSGGMAVLGASVSHDATAVTACVVLVTVALAPGADFSV
jgi:quercetin dioxygenase-like cupin family protein